MKAAQLMQYLHMGCGEALKTGLSRELQMEHQPLPVKDLKQPPVRPGHKRHAKRKLAR